MLSDTAIYISLISSPGLLYLGSLNKDLYQLLSISGTYNVIMLIVSKQLFILKKHLKSPSFHPSFILYVLLSFTKFNFHGFNVVDFCIKSNLAYIRVKGKRTMWYMFSE